MTTGYPNAEQDLVRLKDVEDREEQIRGIIDGLQLMGEQIRYQFRHAEDNGLSEKVRKQEETQASINKALAAQIEQESGVMLYLDSTRGTIFKNNTAQTTIMVAVYKRGERITNATRMHLVFGPDAYLQWYIQTPSDSSFIIVPSSDSRISNDGFSFTVSAADVDSRIVLMCKMIDEGETRTENQVTIAKVLDGSSGTGIDAMSVYYLLQGSALTPPAKPTTNPPGGNWHLTEPTYTAGSTNSLYTVFLTVYSDNSFDYSEVSLSSSYEAAKAAYNKAATAEAGVTELRTQASAEEQLIYITKPSGTNTVSPYTTWVTQDGDVQNTWTLKRPTYSSSYPVLFIAKQRKNVAGTVTCTTPLKDDTTTIIDGGHITTGTIDASRVTVTNIDASEITTGALTVRDANNNIIFQADKDAKSVVIAGWTADASSLRSSNTSYASDMVIGDGQIIFRSSNSLISNQINIHGSVSKDSSNRPISFLSASLGGSISLRNITFTLVGADATYYELTDVDGNIAHKITGNLTIQTGNLTIQKNDNPFLQLKSLTADSSASTSSTNIYETLAFYDKNGLYIGYIQSILNANGNSRLSFGARRKVNGNDATNSFEIAITNTGAALVSLSHPAAWRSALGLGTPITVANGGTGQTGVSTTSTVSEIISLGSGWTASLAQFATWGKVGMLRMNVSRSTAQSSAAEVTVGTLVAGKRPVINTGGTRPNDPNKTVYIKSNGEVSVYGSFAADATIAIVATYILA